VNARTTLLILVAVLSLVVSGCGPDTASKESAAEKGAPGDPDADRVAAGAESFNRPFTDVEAYPVVLSSEIVVGRNRFQLGLLNDNDAPIGSPHIDVSVRFFDLSRSASRPVTHKDMEFISTAEGQGVYVGTVEFDASGRWGAEVTIEGGGIKETVRTSFVVSKKASTPSVGEKVPASDSLTITDVAKLSEITTDPTPVRRFYERSVAQAVEAGEPFVVAFATPEFCQSAVCGPTLDIVNKVARAFRKLTFIHVEIYRDLDPTQPVVPAVSEWDLPTEPWVFVVGADGRVAAKYEGSVSPEELRRDLQKL
jgi:hypothetical protein